MAGKANRSRARPAMTVLVLAGVVGLGLLSLQLDAGAARGERGPLTDPQSANGVGLLQSQTPTTACDIVTQQLTASQQQYAAGQSQLAQLQGAMVDLQLQVVGLQVQVRPALATLQAYQQALGQALQAMDDVAQLVSQIPQPEVQAQAAVRLQSLQQQLAGQPTRVQGMQQNVQQLQQQLSQVSQQAQTARTQLTMLPGALGQLQDTIAGLQMQRSEQCSA